MSSNVVPNVKNITTSQLASVPTSGEALVTQGTGNSPQFEASGIELRDQTALMLGAVLVI